VVTFFMSKDTRETHTASFGPEAYLTALANGFISNTGAIDPRDAYPSSPPGTVTLSPNSHGNGFANVGALDRDPTTPLPVSGTIDFTTPGTYHYICLIHSFMHGTIIVK
jgi:plastocyanin